MLRPVRAASLCCSHHAQGYTSLSMRKLQVPWVPLIRGFSDFLFCLFKVCDAISKWEQALKELYSGKSEGGTRVLKLTYKNRC